MMCSASYHALLWEWSLFECCTEVLLTPRFVYWHTLGYLPNVTALPAQSVSLDARPLTVPGTRP